MCRRACLCACLCVSFCVEKRAKNEHLLQMKLLEERNRDPNKLLDVPCDGVVHLCVKIISCSRKEGRKGKKEMKRCLKACTCRAQVTGVLHFCCTFICTHSNASVVVSSEADHLLEKDVCSSADRREEEHGCSHVLWAIVIDAP